MKHFDIHLTVHEKDRQSFIATCLFYNIKYIDMFFENNLIQNHLMTSVQVSCDYADIEKQLIFLKYIFKDVSTIRHKIEVNNLENEADFKYAEVHLKLPINLKEKINELEGWFVSYNANKPSFVYFTQRVHTIAEAQNLKLNCEVLKETLLLDLKIHLEYCIYDDNENLDKLWLSC